MAIYVPFTGWAFHKSHGKWQASVISLGIKYWDITGWKQTDTFLGSKDVRSFFREKTGWTLPTEGKPRESRINRKQLLQKQTPRMLSQRRYGCRIPGIVRPTTVCSLCLLVSLNANTLDSPARIITQRHAWVFSDHCAQIPHKKQLKGERTYLGSQLEKRTPPQQVRQGSSAQSASWAQEQVSGTSPSPQTRRRRANANTP